MCSEPSISMHTFFSRWPHFVWSPCKRFYSYSEIVLRKTFSFSNGQTTFYLIYRNMRFTLSHKKTETISPFSLKQGFSQQYRRGELAGGGGSLHQNPKGTILPSPAICLLRDQSRSLKRQQKYLTAVFIPDKYKTSRRL